MDKQKTIKKEVSLSGIGLHTASKAKITFKPAEAGAGINFIRVDVADKPVIRKDINNIFLSSSMSRRTSLGKEGLEVQTIEHLMAAVSGLGIDNLNIEINNKEVPGMDGSSLDFTETLLSAGIVEQEKERQYFLLKEPLYVEEGSSSIVALPCPDFKISYTLNYNNSMLKSEFLELKATPEVFKSEIAPARTFCLEAEAGELQRQGFGQGANYDNTLVVGEKGVINNTLRFEDEFVRHKILDLMGDLFLVDFPIRAHIIALKSGHSLNLKIARKISEQIKKNTAAGIPAGMYQPVSGEILDVEAIKKILPHREPFLFVDKIIHLEHGKRAVGIKNVTINDYFFKGHFPGRPVMPGVIMVEAMAQVGGVMMLALEENRGKLAFFMTINNIKFRKTVVPGDQLVLEVVAGRMKSKTGQVLGKALVDGKVVCEAELMFAIVEG
ncbi:MAG: bifunctional UDP-3-O-[3-hydroxymyristoyl] N-acetylglucosamine deacetylase/3-hydroxyacyl-ACP dehydratase [Candidatus Omnitrophota bacterium]|jgi:UDP-3-O-[3-hydroxymyristoyl] N-acetylglucosamine deacetylase/3-hydroxyacyl-[acyl-carrier-protein] dehydratase